MRGLAYIIAAVAAVGIIIGIASLPNQEAGDVASSPAPATAASIDAAPAQAEPMTEPGELLVSVPSMHCQFACFPRVKEAIERADGVESVELAEQKEEGVLDNRQVIVKYKPGFDINDALTMLSSEGFEDSELVQ